MINALKRYIPNISITRKAPGHDAIDRITAPLARMVRQLNEAGQRYVIAANKHRDNAKREQARAAANDMHSYAAFRRAENILNLIG